MYIIIINKGWIHTCEATAIQKQFCSMRQIFLLFCGFHIYIYKFTAHGPFSLSPANITFQSIVVFKSAA